MPARENPARPADKPLFVRLTAEDADRLHRAALESGMSKRELVTEMVQRYLPAEPGEAEGTHEADPLVVGPGEVRVGRHSFRPAAPAEVLTLEQAAVLLQVEPEAVAALAEAGDVPARRIGDEWRFSRAALLGWLGAA